MPDLNKNWTQVLEFTIIDVHRAALTATQTYALYYTLIMFVYWSANPQKSQSFCHLHRTAAASVHNWQSAVTLQLANIVLLQYLQLRSSTIVSQSKKAFLFFCPPDSFLQFSIQLLASSFGLELAEGAPAPFCEANTEGKPLEGCSATAAAANAGPLRGMQHMPPNCHQLQGSSRL